MADAVPTVLVIDGDDRALATVAAALDRMGYRCSAGAGGAAAPIGTGDGPVDLVIVDADGVADDGIALVTAIRRASDAPIIAVTRRRRTLEGRHRDVARMTIVAKPFDPERLVDLVESELVMSGCVLPVCF